MSVMAGLMRMTKAELCDVCEFIGAMDFNRYMTKNDLCQVIIDRITVQPTATTEHKNTTHQHPSALRAEVVAARAALNSAATATSSSDA
jgi:hypothetical protein